jgi:ubiquinone/menaquinone biosynthesis C-methylase UbiE
MESNKNYLEFLDKRMENYKKEIIKNTGSSIISKKSQWLLDKVKKYYLDLNVQGENTYREFIQFTKGYKVGNKLLDYGSGAGALACVFGEKGYEVFGVDPDIDSVNMAKLRNCNSNVSFHLLENDVLPFEDNKFDIITSKSVIEHVENKEKYFDEVVRVLKDDGIFYIAYNCNKWFYLEHHALLPMYKCLNGRENAILENYKFQPYWKIQPQTYNELKKLLDKKNFKYKIIPGRFIISDKYIGRVLNKISVLILGSIGILKYVCSGWVVIAQKKAND